MGGSRVKLPLSVQTLSVSKQHSWFTYGRVVNILKGYQSTRPWKAQQRQTNALQHLEVHHGSRSIPTIVFSDHNAHVQVFVASTFYNQRLGEHRGFMFLNQTFVNGQNAWFLGWRDVIMIPDIYDIGLYLCFLLLNWVHVRVCLMKWDRLIPVTGEFNEVAVFGSAAT